MATAMPSLDAEGTVGAYLLQEYYLRMTDPRLDANERLALRMKLEYFLDDVVRQVPDSPPRLNALLSRPFRAAEITEELVPAARWYLQFIGRRREYWFEVRSTVTVARIIMGTSDWSTREQAVRLILSVDFALVTPSAESRVVTIFRTLKGLTRSGELSESGESLVRLLVHEMRTGPPTRQGRSLEGVALDILRACLAGDSTRVSPALISHVLDLGRDLGTETTHAWEYALSR